MYKSIIIIRVKSRFTVKWNFKVFIVKFSVYINYFLVMLKIIWMFKHFQFLIHNIFLPFLKLLSCDIRHYDELDYLTSFPVNISFSTSINTFFTKNSKDEILFHINIPCTLRWIHRFSFGRGQSGVSCSCSEF